MSNLNISSSQQNHLNYSSFDDVDHNNDRRGGNGRTINGIVIVNNDPLSNSTSGSKGSYESEQQQQQPYGRPSSNYSTRYRGFSSSIHDMYLDPDHERTDCCAITCCGTLQSDRDRFLLTGTTPPGPLKRCTLHILLPLTIFVSAGVAAQRIHPAYLNEIICVLLLISLTLYFCMQCGKGRTKRTRIRKDLLYMKYQILLQQEHIASLSPRSYGRTFHDFMVDHEQHPDLDDNNRVTRNNNSNNNRIREYMMGQTSRDIRSAHPCCLIGCYPEDRIYHDEGSDGELDAIGSRSNNTCSYLLNMILNPLCCGMAVQCCGTCAIAQEAREIERSLLPATYRRIDYITMEPFMNYYPAIYQYKLGVLVDATGNTSTSTTSRQSEDIDERTQATMITSTYSFVGNPLSRLSYRCLQTLFMFLFLMLGWVVVSPYYWDYLLGRKIDLHHFFGIWDYAILVATFGHAFILMAILTYITNYKVYTKDDKKPIHSGLSIDALIKFFAAGFFLSASLAFFWEVVAVLIVDACVSVTLALSGVDMMNDPSTNDSYNHGDDDFVKVSPGMLWKGVPSLHLSHIMGSSVENSPLLSPFFHRGMEATGSSKEYMDVFGMDHPFLYTVYLAVGAFFVAGLIEELCKYFGYRMAEEHPDFLNQKELEEALQIAQARYETYSSPEKHEDDEESHGTPEVSNSRLASIDFSKQLKSIQAHGAAITLAMVATAIGFSCCENLIYIFVYAGSSVSLELGVLIERAFFPLHPIVAAIQSIGVCQRDLERSRQHHLGRILLPAVIVHGCFDFFILWIDFVGKLKGEDITEGDLEITSTAELLSVLSCVVVMIGGLLYFVVEASRQRERLADLDRQRVVDRSSLI